MTANPHEPPQVETIRGSEMPFVLRWRRIAIGLGIFALITIVYLLCWWLGLATEQPKF